jgi:hypothetical protein
MGLPLRMLELATAKAMALSFPRGDDGRFKYMCGIIWNQIDEHEIDYSLTEETVSVFTTSEVESYAYQHWSKGYEVGRLRAASDDLLAQLIDGTRSRLFNRMFVGS